MNTSIYLKKSYRMSQFIINEAKLKQIVRDAINETLNQKPKKR